MVLPNNEVHSDLYQLRIISWQRVVIEIPLNGGKPIGVLLPLIAAGLEPMTPASSVTGQWTKRCKSKLKFGPSTSAGFRYTKVHVLIIFKYKLKAEPHIETEIQWNVRVSQLLETNSFPWAMMPCYDRLVYRRFGYINVSDVVIKWLLSPLLSFREFLGSILGLVIDCILTKGLHGAGFPQPLWPNALK
jgi:hypothetical protein